MGSPNLLFIFTDEQRADTMAAYGNTKIQTPNLDRLARQSVLFERAYVTQTVCTPSRSTLLTGLYPHTNGCVENNLPLRPDTPCLPEMLPPGRWATGYHGKWHLGDEIFAQHGFEEWRGIEDAYAGYYGPGRDRNARSAYHHWLIEQGVRPQNGSAFGRGEAARLPEHLGKPAFLARTASDFIRRHRAEPFVLFVNFLEPHMPFFGPRDAQHAPGSVDLPANFGAPPTVRQPLKTRMMQRHYEEKGFGGPLRSEDDWRGLIARYWGLCSLVDTHVGAILRTLEECGLDDKTIVVYTSDHGDMMGSHRLLAKCVQFEEAARVPMMIRLPGQRDGRRVAAPVSHIDMIPTLLDLLDAPAPPHLQGRSLRPELEGRASAPRDVVFEWNGMNNGMGDKLGGVSLSDSMTALATPEQAVAAIGDPVRSIVSPDGWKLNCSPLGEHELYNLNEDPIETRNLYGQPETRAVAARLRQGLAQWQERTADAVSLPAM
ncbi:MAG TPA: sulfatase-like hydrolase/transferase [Candidatus Brocadiia bacterium]|nr:sulfatase-like hydrolase/transferase [Candidatus Brocadiia bacterium]